MSGALRFLLSVDRIHTPTLSIPSLCVPSKGSHTSTIAIWHTVTSKGWVLGSDKGLVVD